MPVLVGPLVAVLTVALFALYSYFPVATSVVLIGGVSAQFSLLCVVGRGPGLFRQWGLTIGGPFVVAVQPTDLTYFSPV